MKRAGAHGQMGQPNTANAGAGLQAELLACWRRLPNKAFFFVLLAAWLGLFQLLGTSTFGYVPTHSLFGWMWNAYSQKDSPDSHGPLVPLVVLALFYVKRKELVKLPFANWWSGLLILAGAALLHFVGYWVQQPRLSIIALFAGIWGLMGLAWGPAWLRAALFPYFLLVFCVPMGSLAEPISFPMRLLVSKIVAVFGHGVLGIDVIRDGTTLRSGVGHFEYEVAAASAGLRSLVATVGLAVVYAFLFFPSFWRRAVLVLSAFPLAVLGNVVRMLTIVIAAEFGGQNAGAYVHRGGPLGVLSLLPYVPAFAGLLLIGWWLERPAGRTAAPALPEAP